jgi:hypothetical protein
MKNRNITFTTIVLLLGFLALSPIAQAVSPAPDGGYPGGNTAEGQNALLRRSTGTYDTAVGVFSLESDTTGSFNTALGAGTLLANTGGTENTATGIGALLSNTTGAFNTANGAFALFSNTTGAGNAANGGFALFSNTVGEDNIAIGYQALYSNTIGAENTAIGDSALQFNTSGNFNTVLGAIAGDNISTANNVICIGASVAGANMDNTTWIGNIYQTATVSGTTLPVVVSDGGQLGTAPSARRFKKDIKGMDEASEAILAVKPVTFHYKIDKTDTPQFGLIAEEVAEVNPDLVVRDNNGEIYSVRYDAVNAMLLNEFLKEHKKVQQLEVTVAEQRNYFETTIAELKKEIESVVARSKDQEQEIQKVSARVQVNDSVSQLVANKP